MGDPKKPKKKYRKPLMVWNEERIAKDKNLISEFGLRNKKEIWKIESKLKSIHDQAKNLIANTSEQGKKESEQLIQKLASQNLIPGSSKTEDILSLTAEDLLNRRLQTIVFKKGLSRTIKQARQFITHNHISLNGQVVNTPSYIVKTQEESQVSFNPASTIANEAHAERPKDEDLAKVRKAKAQAEEKVKPEIKAEEKKDEPEAKAKEEEPKVAESKPEVPKAEVAEVKDAEVKDEKIEIKEAQPKAQSPEEKLENATPEERVTHKEK